MFIRLESANLKDRGINKIARKIVEKIKNERDQTTRLENFSKNHERSKTYLGSYSQNNMKERRQNSRNGTRERATSKN